MTKAAVLPVPFFARARISRWRGRRNGFLLNGGRFFEPGFEDAHEQLALEEHVLEFGAFCRCYIFRLRAIIFFGPL